jgi:hypothetical protein
MDIPYIEAKIIRLKPGAAYMDKIYDQSVYLELPDGKIIDIFDHMMICTPEMVGNIKKITILVTLVFIKKIIKEIYEIIPAKDSNKKPSGNGHIFIGKIVSKDEKYKDIIVDVGYGLILSDTDGKFNEFQVGDFVEIYSVRADLEKISN